MSAPEVPEVRIITMPKSGTHLFSTLFDRPIIAKKLRYSISHVINGDFSNACVKDKVINLCSEDQS